MRKIIEKLSTAAKRLREPSTLAGLSALAMLAGLPPGTVELWTQVLVGVTGVAAVVLPEVKGE